MEISKLVIKRSMWGYVDGPDSLSSALIRGEDGKMCCLGFLGVACGVDMYVGQRMPRYQQAGWPERFAATVVGHAQPATRWAVGINDDEDIPREAKEEKLISLFAENGIELTFED